MEFTTFVSFFTLGLFIYVFFGIRSLSESHRSLIASHDSCCEHLKDLDIKISILEKREIALVTKFDIHALEARIQDSNVQLIRALEARIQALNDHLAAVSTCAKEEACEPSTAEKIKARKKKL